MTIRPGAEPISVDGSAVGVVLCHGYPDPTIGSLAAGMDLSELGQRIASTMGWSVFTFRFRGCGKSGGNFSLGGWRNDILAAVEGQDDQRGARFKTPVGEAMTRDVRTLQAHQPIDALPEVFDRDEVALVVDGEEFVGVITRVDLINHLRMSA